MSSRAAEIFPPGVFIKEELDAHNWTQVELAHILGRSPAEVSELISAKKAITPLIAAELGYAFGTGAQLWMDRESSYQLQRINADEEGICRRARLYKLGPIREMVRRRWLGPSSDIDTLERQVRVFFGVSNLDDEARFPCVTRTSSGSLNQAHVAWLHRGKQMATRLKASPFSQRSFEDGLGKIRKLLSKSSNVTQLPGLLAETGIRFLVVEHLPRTRIDGAAFWLDETSPVIMLSLRYDRVDWFWFTLAHELGHICRRDGLHGCESAIDTNLVGDGLPKEGQTDTERVANEFAAEFLIDQSEFALFVEEAGRRYSSSKILAFADKMSVHPGIVLGQLHHRGLLTWSRHRHMLEKVRDAVVRSAVTDGWRQSPKEGDRERDTETLWLFDGSEI